MTVSYPEPVPDGVEFFVNVVLGDVACPQVDVEPLIERLSVSLERQRQRRKLLLRSTIHHNTAPVSGRTVFTALMHRPA